MNTLKELLAKATVAAVWVNLILAAVIAFHLIRETREKDRKIVALQGHIDDMGTMHDMLLDSHSSLLDHMERN